MSGRQDFTVFYEAINDDEEKFVGELRAEPAKLSFNVDFYGRGTFPPGAYHSEGHQDGMGLCLYLALMKYTLGDKFTFAVLDDVLMSVDTGHRREVCRLLKTQFPNTQFVMTTHDRVWLQYMKTENLINKTQIFGGWTVENGPRIWDDKDIWSEIESALSINRVYPGPPLCCIAILNIFVPFWPTTFAPLWNTGATQAMISVIFCPLFLLVGKIV